MLETVFGDASVLQILAVAVSAVLIGINKTGVPGLGLLPVIILTLALDPARSAGMQLVMLCTADVLAMLYYRRKGNWRIVLRMVPSAFCGLAIGSFAVRFLHGPAVAPVVGGIILLLCILTVVRSIVWKDSERIPRHWAFTVFTGIAAGITTQIANAAGPVMALYLLSLHLKKEEYMGTNVWFFLIMNWTKLPLFLWEGRVVPHAFLVDLAMLPMLILGAVIGIVFMKKIPAKQFEQVILGFSAVAALYMIFRPCFS